MSDIALCAVAGAATLLCWVLSLGLAHQHWTQWLDPRGQSLTLSIIALAPVYATARLLSVAVHRLHLYSAAACELYEAFVLYQFYALMWHYFERRVAHLEHFTEGCVRRRDRSAEIPFEERRRVTAAVRTARAKAYFESVAPVELLWGLVYIEPSVQLLEAIQWAVVQYAPVRLVYSLLVIALAGAGHYHHRSLSFDGAYFWLNACVNVSISVAIAAVLLFLALARDELWQHDPMLKFGSLKLIIFFIFWQSVLFTLLDGQGALPLPVDTFDSAVVCVEMAVLALYHIWIFRSDETRLTSALWARLRFLRV